MSGALKHEHAPPISGGVKSPPRSRLPCEWPPHCAKWVGGVAEQLLVNLKRWHRRSGSHSTRDSARNQPTVHYAS